MPYFFWIAFRGIAFWLGVFYAFTLGWGPLELSFLPRALSAPVMLMPVASLIFGAVLPDKALSAGKHMRILFGIVLAAGFVGCVITGINDFIYQNMIAVWLRVLAGVVTILLSSRAILIKSESQRSPAPTA